MFQKIKYAHYIKKLLKSDFTKAILLYMFTGNYEQRNKYPPHSMFYRYMAQFPYQFSALSASLFQILPFFFLLFISLWVFALVGLNVYVSHTFALLFPLRN